MSAVSEARQRAGATGSRPLAVRLLHWLLALLLVLVVAVLGGVGLLAWRLSQGPMDVGWLARRVEATAFPKDAPTRLRIGAASIAWQGYRAGADQGLELRLRDVRVVNRSGAQGAEVARADLTLSLARLFELEAAPRSVVVSGLRLGAVRAADGTVSLDLGALTEGDSNSSEPGPTLQQTMAELRRPASRDQGRTATPGLEQLSQLDHVQVDDAEITLADRALATTVQTRIEALDLRRLPEGGVKGTASGQVSMGGATASLQLDAQLAQGGGTHVEAKLAPVQAGALARSNPALASLGALDSALQAEASLDLSPQLQPRAAELHAEAGAGAFLVEGTREAFGRVAIDAAASWSGSDLRPDRLTLKHVEAVLTPPSGSAPTTVSATGQVTRAAGKIGAKLDIGVDRLSFADLPALWPPALGGGARPWLAQNVTGGIARDGAFTLTLVAPEDDLGSVAITDAGGTLRGEDVTVHWLRPVAPLEHGQALLRVLGPDVIDIAVPSAVQGAIAVRDGDVRFTGLSQPDQDATITLTAAGSVPEIVTLLRHPRLRLLDRHPLPIKSSAGTMVGRLSVALPMKKDLDFDSVKIGAQGKLSGLRLGGIVAGRDLDNGEIQYGVTQDGLKASGQAAVANIAGAVNLEMDFRPGPPTQVQQKASLTGKANAKQLAAAGIDPDGLMTGGVAGLSAAYVAQRDGTNKVDVKADFKEAGLALLGWRKAPGPPTDASASILLDHDKLAGISAIRAQGPGLQIVARADMAGDKPSLLRFERLVLGPTEASGEVRFPPSTDQPIRARLTGTVLDLSTELSSKPTNRPPKSEPNERGTPWIADIRFDRVLLAKERGIGGVVAHAEYDGKRLRVLQANTTGPERVQAVIAPQGQGRRVSVRAADGGALLRALDVTDSVRGGALALEGQYDDRYADPPLSGTVDLSNFTVQDVVAVGKLLQAITVYGIVDAVRGGQGVQFSRLMMPFRYGSDVLELGEARAFSASLGVTAQGRIDLGRKQVNVHGTIVPAYALNSALGRIPLIGRLFSPERGGGLVAVNYSVIGALADPNVVVNPLSALTPGFLRGLFKMFD